MVEALQEVVLEKNENFLHLLASSAWLRLLRESSQRRQQLNQTKGLPKDAKGSYSQLTPHSELKPF